MKQLQSRPVERSPIRNAVICSNVQLSSSSSHFTEGYSGPICSTRFFLLCPFRRLLGFFRAPHLSNMVPPPPNRSLLCNSYVTHSTVVVADYGLVADLFKVRHIFANWLLHSILQYCIFQPYTKKTLLYIKRCVIFWGKHLKFKKKKNSVFTLTGVPEMTEKTWEEKLADVILSSTTLALYSRVKTLRR